MRKKYFWSFAQLPVSTKVYDLWFPRQGSIRISEASGEPAPEAGGSCHVCSVLAESTGSSSEEGPGNQGSHRECGPSARSTVWLFLVYVLLLHVHLLGVVCSQMGLVRRAREGEAGTYVRKGVMRLFIPCVRG